jgi:hypothetical protein
MVNLPKSYPFKGARTGYVFLFWLDSSFAHWVDAEWDFPQMSQPGARLHVNWVNAESTRHQHLWRIHHSALTQFMWSLTLGWLSDMESHLVLTQLTGNETRCQLSHRWMLKNSNKSANSRAKSITLKSFIICPIYVWSVLSCKCTFKSPPVPAVREPAPKDCRRRGAVLWNRFRFRVPIFFSTVPVPVPNLKF